MTNQKNWREHVLLVAPPGAGKTFWARLQASKVPEGEWWKRSLDAEKLYRLASVEERMGSDPKTFRPLRAPHHTISERGLSGTVAKGWQIRPGELSLAHGGIFFMDEAAEFSSRAIEYIADATRKGYVEPCFGAMKLPAEFRLIVATNPCPCGFRNMNRAECRCTDKQVERYLERLAPLRALCRELHPNEWQPEVTALAREQARQREEAERNLLVCSHCSPGHRGADGLCERHGKRIVESGP